MQLEDHEQVGVLETAVVDQRRRAEELEAAVAAEQARSGELEQSLAAARASVSELEDAVASDQARAGEFETLVAAEQARSGELERSLVEAQARVGELESELTAAAHTQLEEPHPPSAQASATPTCASETSGAVRWDGGSQRALSAALVGLTEWRSILDHAVRTLGVEGGWDAAVAWYLEKPSRPMACAANGPRTALAWLRWRAGPGGIGWTR